MSLHDEFKAAKENKREVSYYMGPFSGKLAELAEDAPELVRRAILRTRAGDHSTENSIGFTIDLKWVEKKDFMPEMLEKLPGYRRLVEVMADPAIDIGFTIGFTNSNKTIAHTSTINVKIDPAKTFKDSMLTFRGDHYSDYSEIYIGKDGPPAWALTKPKFGLSVGKP